MQRINDMIDNREYSHIDDTFQTHQSCKNHQRRFNLHSFLFIFNNLEITVNTSQMSREHSIVRFILDSLVINVQ